MSDSPRFATPEEAENAFYEAWERGDLEALMAVWADDEDVVCIHPGSPRLTGHAQIRETWQQILSQAPNFSVRLLQRIRWQGGLLAIHSLHEQFLIPGGDAEVEPVLATNVYVRGGDGWRLLSHHASNAPELPDSLGEVPRVLH